MYLVPGKQVCIGKDNTVLPSRSLWSRSEDNMLVNAMIKGYTGCCGNGKRNELLREGGQRRGFTEMPQTHV